MKFKDKLPDFLIVVASVWIAVFLLAALVPTTVRVIKAAVHQMVYEDRQCYCDCNQGRLPCNCRDEKP